MKKNFLQKDSKDSSKIKLKTVEDLQSNPRQAQIEKQPQINDAINSFE